MGLENKFTIDIVPFGVLKKDNGVYARFKILLVPNDNIKSEENFEVTVENLQEVFDQFQNNGFHWVYNISKNGEQSLIEFKYLRNSEIDNNLYKDIEFAFRDIVTNEFSYDNKPHFGTARRLNQRVTTNNGHVQHMFNFLLSKEREIQRSFEFSSNKLESKIVGQDDKYSLMQDWSKNQLIDVMDRNQDPIALDIGSKLNDANLYSLCFTSKDFFQEDDKNKLKFKAILGAIMEEPEIAEKLFGLIREIQIPIEEVYFDSGIPMNYSIQFQTTIPESHYNFTKKGYTILKTQINGNYKYYNGIEVPIINNRVDKFYDKITSQIVDPYKAQLLKKDTPKVDLKSVSPDGIYCLVEFPKNNDNQNINQFDTFEHEKLEDAKGFNIVVLAKNTTTHKTEFKSLTYHRKLYTVRKKHYPSAKKWKIEANDIGVIEGSQKLHTSSGQYYSNLLFAWRGDNLSVNRTDAKRGKDADDVDETGPMKSEYSIESDFVNNELFSSSTSLIPGTNLQLNDGNEYSFYMRVVNICNYAIPLTNELISNKTSILNELDQLAYTLTLEEYLSIQENKEDFLFFKNNFNLFRLNELSHKVPMIPTKGPLVIGKESFNFSATREDKKMDQHTHMILNKYTQHDLSESRQIFPPAIKLEDFKLLGFLSSDRLNATSREDFVNKAIKLEERFQVNAPKDTNCSSIINRKINYLADPRAHYIYFYPNSSNTLLKVKPIKLNAFPFGITYPYYESNKHDLKSIEIKLKKTSERSNALLLKNASNTILFQDELPNGVFDFKVYSHYNDDIETAINNGGIDLQISSIAKPIKPNFLVENIERNAFKLENRNFWFASLNSKHTDFLDAESWKSIKYQEVNNVLKLKSHGLVDRNAPHNKSMMINEYPYDFFLVKEGGYGKNSALKTSIHSDGFRLRLNLSPILVNLIKEDSNKEILKIRLNQENVLLVLLVNQQDYNVYLNNVFITTVSNVIDFKLKIVEIDNVPEHQLILNDCIYQPLDTNKWLDQEFGINNLVLHQALIYTINTDENVHFDFKMESGYHFLTDEKSPYYCEKEIRLFASSPYQGYFKEGKKEFDLGTLSNRILTNIPNNVEPIKPSVTSETLLAVRLEKKGEVQKKITRNLIQLKLSQDFMLEGRNKLAIILESRKINPADQIDVINSSFGEDITKLNKDQKGLVKPGLEDHIDFSDKRESVYAKYYNRGDVKWYKNKFEDAYYKVLECQPFYDVKTCDWQVVLSFQDFEDIETVFFKLYTMKVSIGHGLERNIIKGTQEYYYEDRTGTNLSRISNDIELPIYTRKEVRIEKIKINGKKHIKINNTGPSTFKGKLIGICQSNFDFNETIVGTEELNKEGEKEFVEFSVQSIDMNDKMTEQGKFLMINTCKEIIISEEHSRYLVFMEFEKHDNFDDIAFEENGLFRKENPLFDLKLIGLRFIGASVFEI